MVFPAVAGRALPALRDQLLSPRPVCQHPPKAPRNTNRDGNKVVMPKAWYVNTIAPTGAAFCAGCQIEGAEGRLLTMLMTPPIA